MTTDGWITLGASVLLAAGTVGVVRAGWHHKQEFGQLPDPKRRLVSSWPRKHTHVTIEPTFHDGELEGWF